MRPRAPRPSPSAGSPASGTAAAAAGEATRMPAQGRQGGGAASAAPAARASSATRSAARQVRALKRGRRDEETVWCIRGLPMVFGVGRAGRQSPAPGWYRSAGSTFAAPSLLGCATRGGRCGDRHRRPVVHARRYNRRRFWQRRREPPVELEATPQERPDVGARSRHPTRERRRPIHGTCEPAFAAVRDAFAANFANDLEVGACFTAAVAGKTGGRPLGRLSRRATRRGRGSATPSSACGRPPR